MSTPPSGLTPDPNAPTAADWLRLIPAVNACGEEMGALMSKYGLRVFAINIGIFWDSTPNELILMIERYRYINSRMQEGSMGKTTRLFVSPVDPRKDNG